MLKMKNGINSPKAVSPTNRTLDS